jgi:hypothetical protein
MTCVRDDTLNISSSKKFRNAANNADISKLSIRVKTGSPVA